MTHGDSLVYDVYRGDDQVLGCFVPRRSGDSPNKFVEWVMLLIVQPPVVYGLFPRGPL